MFPKKIFNLFLLCALFCGFLISADYAIIRPVSNSLFLHFYGSDYLPYAWILGVPFSFLVVSLYNRYLSRLGCLRMFFLMASLITCGNVLCALFVNQFPQISFVFYAWKEVYIMLMFQQLWSIIHSKVKKEQAKYLYGLLFAGGAFGGIVGSLVPGFLAVQMGSESLIFSTIPIYILLSVFFFYLTKLAGPINFEKKGDFLQGFKLITTSRLLLFILMIVALMQICSTLIDYQFQISLQNSYPDKDLRTAYAGKIFSLMHTITFSLQFLGSYLLVKLIGLRLSHFLVPFVLALSHAAYLIVPSFGVIACSFMMIKSFDFSIFGVIREMLYIPMKSEEKFHAKAFIDVFAYRSVKALASFLILVIAPAFLSWANISLFVIWCIIVIKYFKELPAHEKAHDRRTATQ